MNLDGDWTNPFLLEMKVANIISLQAKHGTKFNHKQCNWYIHSLTERILNIDRVLIPLLPPMLNKGTEYKKPFKLNGQFMKFPGDYCERVGLERHEVGGPFTAMWYTPFDPSKSARVKSVMLDMGWLPTEWNEKKMPFQMWRYRKKLNKISYSVFVNGCSREDKELYTTLVDGFIEKHFKNQTVGYMKAILFSLGFDPTKKPPTFDQIKKKLLLKQFWPASPKITEDSFESLSEDSSEAMMLLKERMIYAHRRSLLQGLMKHLRPDGKLSGECNPCATPTARGRHKIIVNIPAAGAVFGRECRSLFMGDYNGITKAMVVRGKDNTDSKVEAGLVRRKPGTNILQEFDKGSWCDAGYWSYLIPAGHDVFVGGDGSALELRMLAHYLVFACKLRMAQCEESGNMEQYEYFKQGLQAAFEYREQILSGDIHTHNKNLAGLPTRGAAKSFIYCYLMF